MSETEWIKVSERLPPVGTDVLVYDGTFCFEGFLRRMGGWEISSKGPYAISTNVTHWMELTKPTKE